MKMNKILLILILQVVNLSYASANKWVADIQVLGPIAILRNAGYENDGIVFPIAAPSPYTRDNPCALFGFAHQPFDSSLEATVKSSGPQTMVLLSAIGTGSISGFVQGSTSLDTFFCFNTHQGFAPGGVAEQTISNDDGSKTFVHPKAPFFNDYLAFAESAGPLGACFIFGYKTPVSYEVQLSPPDVSPHPWYFLLYYGSVRTDGDYFSQIGFWERPTHGHTYMSKVTCRDYVGAP